jgi:ABC-type lipoprotein export system ATPase subunit
MIHLKDVTKAYELSKGNTVVAVRDLSLEINQGEFVLVVGRSGSGKTTLLNLAAGLTRPTKGQVLMDGVDIWTLSDEEQSRLRNKKIGFVFQFPSLLPTLTVYENVILPAGFHQPRMDGKARGRAAELLESVGLSDKLAAYPRQLSAGQQQRVVIARALMNQSEIIMADEPTSNLDEKTEMEIMALFHDLNRRLGLTILMVTHTTQLFAAGMSKVEMAAGQIIQPSPQPVLAGV